MGWIERAGRGCWLTRKTGWLTLAVGKVVIVVNMDFASRGQKRRESQKAQSESAGYKELLSKTEESNSVVSHAHAATGMHLNPFRRAAQWRRSSRNPFHAITRAIPTDERRKMEA